MELRYNKQFIISMILSFVGLLLIITGFTYAYVYLELKGTESVIIDSGCLKLTLVEGNEINLTSAFPITDQEGLNSNPYTYTIRNICTVDAYYESTFNVINTSTAGNQDKIKIGLSGSSTVLPIIVSNLRAGTLLTASQNISQTYLLDTGYLKPNEEKTFNLKMWIDSSVTSFSGSFNAKVIVNSFAKDGPTFSTATSGYKVFSLNTLSVKTDYNPSFSHIAPYADGLGNYSQTSGLFSTEGNDNKDTYYFRGNVNNNYVKFGKYAENVSVTYKNAQGNNVVVTHNADDDMIWRIIRINEDGSLRLILDDTIGDSAFDSSGNLYGSSSTIKGMLETWYSTHLETLYGEYISDEIFCGSTASYQRLATTHTPSLVCTSPDVSYTVAGSTISKPIGLITADEISFAGGLVETVNDDIYLYNDNMYSWWSITPATMFQGARSFAYTNLLLHEVTSSTASVRPVINLTSDAILSGTGEVLAPYQVIGLYSDYTDLITGVDVTAPTITDASATAERTYGNKPITIVAKDNLDGVGIAGYFISNTDVTPAANNENWIVTTSTTFQTTTTYSNGTYYVWAKDANGNVSTSKQVVVSRVAEIPALSITTNVEIGTTNVIVNVTSNPPEVTPIYKYYYKLSSSENYTTAYIGPEAYYKLLGLTSLSSYDIKVELLDDNGNIIATSNISTIIV